MSSTLAQKTTEVIISVVIIVITAYIYPIIYLFIITRNNVNIVFSFFTYDIFQKWNSYNETKIARVFSNEFKHFAIFVIIGGSFANKEIGRL
jgi:hypothetical protein